MQVQTAQQLLPRIFWVAKAILGQGQAWARDRAHVGIADQRQDGVIKRGGRDFDSSVLCCVGMSGQNLGQQFPLPLNHEALVVKRVIASFSNQSCNVRIVQKEFIEPGDLRKHLQVGKVLDREKLVGALRCAAGAAKPLP